MSINIVSLFIFLLGFLSLSQSLSCIPAAVSHQVEVMEYASHRLLERAGRPPLPWLDHHERET